MLSRKLLSTIIFCLFLHLCVGPTAAQEEQPTDTATATVTTTTVEEEAPQPVTESATTTTTTVVDDTTTTVVPPRTPQTETETRSIEVKQDNEVVAVESDGQGNYIIGGILLILIVGGIGFFLTKKD